MSYVEENKKTLENFTKAMGAENVLEAKITREKRYFVRVKTEKLRDAVT